MFLCRFALFLYTPQSAVCTAVATLHPATRLGRRSAVQCTISCAAHWNAATCFLALKFYLQYSCGLRALRASYTQTSEQVRAVRQCMDSHTTCVWIAKNKNGNIFLA